MCCIDDRKAFDRARADYEANANKPEAIATMLRLSVEAKQPALRGWAATWLYQNCNVRVVSEDADRGEDAAPSKAANGC